MSRKDLWDEEQYDFGEQSGAPYHRGLGGSTGESAFDFLSEGKSLLGGDDLEVGSSGGASRGGTRRNYGGTGLLREEDGPLEASSADHPQDVSYQEGMGGASINYIEEGGDLFEHPVYNPYPEQQAAAAEELKRESWLGGIINHAWTFGANLFCLDASVLAVNLYAFTKLFSPAEGDLEGTLLPLRGGWEIIYYSGIAACTLATIIYVTHSRLPALTDETRDAGFDRVDKQLYEKLDWICLSFHSEHTKPHWRKILVVPFNKRTGKFDKIITLLRGKYGWFDVKDNVTQADYGVEDAEVFGPNPEKTVILSYGYELPQRPAPALEDEAVQHVVEPNPDQIKIANFKETRSIPWGIHRVVFGYLPFAVQFLTVNTAIHNMVTRLGINMGSGYIAVPTFLLSALISGVRAKINYDLKTRRSEALFRGRSDQTYFGNVKPLGASCGLVSAASALLVPMSLFFLGSGFTFGKEGVNALFEQWSFIEAVKHFDRSKIGPLETSITAIAMGVSTLLGLSTSGVSTCRKLKKAFSTIECCGGMPLEARPDVDSASGCDLTVIHRKAVTVSAFADNFFYGINGLAFSTFFLSSYHFFKHTTEGSVVMWTLGGAVFIALAGTNLAWGFDNINAAMDNFKNLAHYLKERRNGEGQDRLFALPHQADYGIDDGVMVPADNSGWCGSCC